MKAHRPTIMGTRHMVAACHYLAAEAGVRILKAGGNAIDAGVAAGITLGVVQPEYVNFAGVAPIIIYSAKDHKLHVLNASGKAPSGETIAFLNSKGYARDPANWGPGSGMPSGGILTVTVPGSLW